MAPAVELRDPEALPGLKVNWDPGEGFFELDQALDELNDTVGLLFVEVILCAFLPRLRDVGLEAGDRFLKGVAGENAVKEAVSKAYTQLGTAPVLGIWNPLSPPWTRDGKVIDEVRKEVAALITE